MMTPKKINAPPGTPDPRERRANRRLDFDQEVDITLERLQEANRILRHNRPVRPETNNRKEPKIGN